MTLIVIFIVSGFAIITLVTVKSLERKRNHPYLLSRAISKGDIQTREIYHRSVRYYSEGKEKLLFLYKKRLPIHSKNLLNKMATILKEKRDQYTNNIRDSRLLKKQEGISEFFRNMSEVEKGNGEIHDVYDAGSQNEKKELD